MIVIINGPNLNLLGKREPEIYGNRSFEDYLPALRDICHALANVELHYIQSNSEGEIIDALQHHGYDPTTAGIIINPGAYAHYSYAIADAIAAIPAPVIEVHISNIHSREEFRRKSVTAAACRGCITGLGFTGYEMAARSLIAPES